MKSSFSCGNGVLNSKYTNFINYKLLFMKKSTFLLSVATLTCIGAGAVASSGTAWFNSSTESIGTLDAEDGDVTVTPDEPVTIEPGTDCTHFLTNPDFSKPDGEGWIWERKDSITSLAKSGGWSYKPCAEAYGGDDIYGGFMFDVYQTVEGMPDGVYSLTVNAFYRPGENGSYDGSESVPAFIYINSAKAAVPHIMSDALQSLDGDNLNYWEWKNLSDYGVYIPNTMYGASEAFGKGLYEKKMYGIVQGGLMKVGIQKLIYSPESDDWCAWSDFRLVYEGTSADAISTLVAPAKEYLTVIEVGFPGLVAELAAAIESAETEGENQLHDVEMLGAVTAQVRKAVEIYPSLTALLEQANALAETLPEEHADFAAAFSAAEAIDVATSASADYVTAYETLKYQFALVNAAYVPMDEWAFNTKIEYTVDGLKYYIDTEHNIARFNGLDYTMGQSELILPDVITIGGNPYCVVAMERNGWRYYSQPNIKSVVLPNTLRRIGSEAFYSFSSLKSLEIPASVESIGTGAFNSSDNLQTITMKPMTPPVCDGNIGGNSQKRLYVPDGSFHAYRIASQWSDCAIVPETPVELTVNVVDAGELGRLVLDEAGYLQEVNKLTVTGELNNDDWASIKNMTNLISIDMSGVLNTSVPDNQFEGKWALEEAVISNKCTSINRYAFQGTGLKEVIIPEGVESIRDHAFYECRKVASVEMPNSVITVGSEAFGGCYALKNIKLSESMSEISYGMLRYAAIEEIDIPASVTIINEYAFQGCASLTSLVCPSSLKVIEYNAFHGCSSLKEIEFNEGLTSIEDNAFYNCTALTEVTLPSSLTHCIDKPFYNCRNLKKIYARSIIPATTNGSCPLSNVPLNDVVLYVPSWSVQEYQLADGWAQFMTVETYDFLPQNVCINKDFTFALLDELAEDDRPNISLQWSEVQSYDSYGNTNYETGNLTINSRSKLPVNDFSLYVSPYKKYFDDYKLMRGYDNGSSSKKYASTSLIVNGEMRAENVALNLLARRNKWQFVCFPFDVQMSDIVPVDPVTQWVIREYSAENRANNKLDETWLNVPSDATLKSGKGYILHCYNPNVSDDLVQFTVSPLRESVNRQAIFIADDRNVALEENISEFEQNRSWNLIGNPYPSYFDSRFLDFDAPITVWNTYDNNYHAYSPVDDAYILSPGEAFFVQRPVDQESIVFEKAGRQTHTYARIIEDEPSAAAARRMAAPVRGHRHVINLHLNGENASDHTRVVINEAASMDYELSRDASKFMSLDADVPQLYSLCNGVRYAINERPLSDGEVVLGVSVGKAGVYTISIPENDENEYIIEDRLMNTSAALSADQPFEFTAEPGDMEGRFILRSLTPGGATSVDSIAEGAAEAGDPAFNTAGQTVNQKVADGIVVKKNRKVIQ